MTATPNTSWQQVSSWYDKIVSQDGHYYHRQVILPGIIRLLKLSEDSKVLDVGCGQGILSRAIPKTVDYHGVDASKSLIAAAKKSTTASNRAFSIADATRALGNIATNFTHAAVVLALQNMEHPEKVIENISAHLITQGKLILVLNHPSFRIPRQSGWNIDTKTKQQYRWANRYSSSLKIPILMNPGQKNQQTTWSFHRPLQDYVAMLKNAGFVITDLEEWSSDKESEGRAAKMENRARKEFPLFLTILAEKR